MLSGPSHGTLSGTVPTLTYTPEANYSGPDSFTFVASDGSLASAPAVVSITVTPVNDVPAAVADAGTAAEGGSVEVPVLANDSDVEGDALTVTEVTQGANGAAANGSGSVTYTHNGSEIPATVSPTPSATGRGAAPRRRF